MTDQPAAIVAATVSCKTLADNTLRLSVDIDPTDAKAAFALFGERGTAVAIAVLTPEVAKADMQERLAKQDQPEHLFSDFARHLFVNGFFNIPKVRQAVLAEMNDTPEQVKVLFKGEFPSYESLADIPPSLIKQWASERRIVFTFLRDE